MQRKIGELLPGLSNDSIEHKVMIDVGMKTSTNGLECSTLVDAHAGREMLDNELKNIKQRLLRQRQQHSPEHVRPPSARVAGRANPTHQLEAEDDSILSTDPHDEDYMDPEEVIQLEDIRFFLNRLKTAWHHPFLHEDTGDGHTGSANISGFLESGFDPLLPFAGANAVQLYASGFLPTTLPKLGINRSILVELAETIDALVHDSVCLDSDVEFAKEKLARAVRAIAEAAKAAERLTELKVFARLEWMITLHEDGSIPDMPYMCPLSVSVPVRSHDFFQWHHQRFVKLFDPIKKLNEIAQEENGLQLARAMPIEQKNCVKLFGDYMEHILANESAETKPAMIRNIKHRKDGDFVLETTHRTDMSGENLLHLPFGISNEAVQRYLHVEQARELQNQFDLRGARRRGMAPLQLASTVRSKSRVLRQQAKSTKCDFDAQCLAFLTKSIDEQLQSLEMPCEDSPLTMTCQDRRWTAGRIELFFDELFENVVQACYHDYTQTLKKPDLLPGGNDGPSDVFESFETFQANTEHRKFKFIDHHSGFRDANSWCRNQRRSQGARDNAFQTTGKSLQKAEIMHHVCHMSIRSMQLPNRCFPKRQIADNLLKHRFG